MELIDPVSFKRKLILILLNLLISGIIDEAKAELKMETVRAFNKYIEIVEKQMGEQWKPGGPFLWVDKTPDIRNQILKGAIHIEHIQAKNGIGVQDGLIHDWIGSIFLPEADMTATVEVLQDFENHAKIYEEVIESRLLERNGDFILGFHRYRKKKIITVILDVEYEATYIKLSDSRQYCRSYSQHIYEIENYGEKHEKRLPEGKDKGFLWRMNAYWNIEAAEDGVFIECRSISLTRDVPSGLGWMIKPFIQNMPKESLMKTLHSTKDAILKRKQTE